jgi:hypothetical protein
LSRAVPILVVAAALLLAAAGTAAAATPFTAGLGSTPSVAVGPDGVGHVVWATPDPGKVGYCRVSPGGAACNRTELLTFGASTNAHAIGRPTVFVPAADKVVVIGHCWNCPTGTTDRTFRWTSVNNGESFPPPLDIDQELTGAGTGTWLDTEGLWVGASGDRVKAADGTSSDGVQYATGSLFVYSSQVIRVPGTTKLVAATNDLDVVKYGVYHGPSLTNTAVNTTGNWLIDRTLPSAEPDNSDTALSAGPNGVFLTYRYFVPNDNRVGLRRFDPATETFGAATYVEGDDPIDNNSLDYPDSFQDPSGRIHVVWRSLYDNQRLRYRVSDTSGTTFSPAANLAKQEGFAEPEIAAGPAGTGFVTWTPNTASGNVRVVAIDPQPEPVVTPPPGGGGTPTTGGGTTGPTIAPTFVLTGPGNTSTAVIIGSRIRVRMKGAIRLPAGSDPAVACTGKVRLKLKKGKRTMLNRTVRVKFRNNRCRFKKTAYLSRAKVGRTRTIRLKIRFMGNTVLKAGSVSKTLTIRK